MRNHEECLVDAILDREYERLVEELKSDERALETQVREARQSIGSLLSQHGVSDAIALSQLIATGQTNKAAAESHERGRTGRAAPTCDGLF